LKVLFDTSVWSEVFRRKTINQDKLKFINNLLDNEEAKAWKKGNMKGGWETVKIYKKRFRIYRKNGKRSGIKGYKQEGI